MSWADEKMIELAGKPQSQWTEDDWDAYHYIEQQRFESGYYDTFDNGSDDYYESNVPDYID